MRYYTIQRLSLAPRNNGKSGFDKYFELEYMGSSEFEWGAANEALRRLRQYRPAVAHYDITPPGANGPTPVYFVGHDGRLDEKAEALQTWLANPRSQELSHFPELLTNTDYRGKPIAPDDTYYRRTVAWWAFDEDVLWTLDHKVAAKLIMAVDVSKITA